MVESRKRRPRSSDRVRATLSVLLLGSTGCLPSRSLAQAGCGVAWTTPFRVDNATAVSILRAAANCTNGGSLVAEWADYAVTVDAPIVIASGTFLSVTGENASAEVHGGLETRLFEVAPGGELTLTQLKMSEGAAENGGAIYSDFATLTLDGCTFDGNVATDGDGGAVWADKGTVTIVGGDFVGNTATRYGGAVLATDARLVIRGSRFESNEASIGGALFCGGVAELTNTATEPSCSITDSEFTSNIANDGSQSEVNPYTEHDGGGAAAFLRTNVSVVDSNFSRNSALRSGGALNGGNATDIKLNGCTFGKNTADRHGGAIVASSLTLGESTRLANNEASSSGGAVFGWDAGGTIEFNDVVCTNNSAINEGGCFYASGSAAVSNGTVMRNNVARNGGCIYAYEGSEINVDGGDFMCRGTERGGFLFAGDGARVRITGGLFANNVAFRRAGAMYCEGGVSAITIEGGTFRDNTALEVGGAIVAWGATTVVMITGGHFSNNIAKFYGGFVFLEEGASLNCKGATIRGNSAGDQGGGIYAREATSVNSSCNLIANESPQGAALYLTHVKSAAFENHEVTGNLASGGSVVYAATSSVVAKDVTFDSNADQADSSNRAIQTVGDTTLRADQCAFEGWAGDTVIYHTNLANDSLVLNSCEFRRSSVTMAVTSPNSNAVIRNAVIGDSMFANAIVGKLNSSMTLVDRALSCSDSTACGAGACVDSALGVLCECLEDGECLDDGGGLSLSLKTPPEAVTVSPSMVSYTLDVSSAEQGTTYAIWSLKAETRDLTLDIVPSNGVLPPGGHASVTVTGTSLTQDVQGNLTSTFVVTSAGSAGSESTTGVKLTVNSTFYFCRAHEYAVSLYHNDSAGVPCKQCATIDGEKGVNCNSPGVTLASLPIREGYWRSSRESLTIHKCLFSEACVGATEVSNSDDYCAEGYEGPYCAVCAQGYGRGVSNSCHYCDDTKAHLLTAAGAIFSLAMLLILLLAAVFLVGGLDAIDIVRDSVVRGIPFRSNTSRSPCVPEANRQGPAVSELGGKIDSLDTTVAPGYESARERKPGVVGGFSSDDGVFTLNYSESNNVERPYIRRLSANFGIGTGVNLSDMTAKYEASNMRVSASQHTRSSTAAGASEGGQQGNRELEATTGRGGQSKCCGLGQKVRRWVPRLPLNKLKIILVVWQILAVFSSITGVEFPASYSTFLSWIRVVNLDLGNIFSTSCVFPSVNFYVRLLISTLGPLVLIGGLLVTYHMAKRLAGIGSAGVIAKRAAWSRHVAAGLLLSFLVFTSVSTVVFKTFACDDDIVVGESYLRADYSISCNTRLHTFFKIYAGLMILIYPLGIPVLYATILWNRRDLLNPRICPDTNPESDGDGEAATRTTSARENKRPTAKLISSSKGRTKNGLTPQNLQELDAKVKARREHPELVPFMFLWKDFGPDLYYYEVVECGRRVLLTGVLIFISPASATQAAMACIFAFGSLVAFELMRPHLDPADSWLYRLGCVIIFLSNFLALLIKVDAGEEGNRAAFGTLLVAVNVFLVLAVLASSWFATQQSVDDSREEENPLTIAKTMLTAEQHSASNARLTRTGRVPISSVSSSVRPFLPSSDPDVVWGDSMAPRGRLRRSGTDAVGNRDTLMNFTRDERVSSAMVGTVPHNSAHHSLPFNTVMVSTESW